MQSRLYKWHVYSALFISLFFTILLLTGIANIFHGKIKQWENPHFFTEVDLDTEILSPEALYRAYSDKHPEMPVILLRKLPGKDKKPIECILLKDQKEVYGYIHPCTADLIGINENPFHKRILKWHTSMTIGKTGNTLMLTVACIIIICLLSGIIYYVRSIQWRHVKKASKKWHFVLGILTLSFNLIMVISGIFLQYQNITKQKRKDQYEYPAVQIHIDSALALAQTFYPEVQVKRIKFPATSKDPIVLIGDQPGSWYLGSMPFELKIDLNTAHISSVVEESSISGRPRWQKTMLTIHAGQYGGNISRWIYLLFSIGTLGSICTGIMNYRNLRNKRRII